MHGIQELLDERTIACPLDGGTLAARGDLLVCGTCAAEYPLLGDRVADLTPPNRVLLPGSSDDYAAHYLAAAAETKPEEAKAYGLIDEIFVGKDSLIALAKVEEKVREPVGARP